MTTAVARRAARVDGNQPSIVADFRKCGFSVAHTHMVGEGFPDIVVGAYRMNFLFELKDPAQPPSKRKLTDDEQEWHDEWKGQIHTIETFEEGLAIIKAAIGRT